MIRNAMFGLSLLALSTGSAFAGSAKHNAKPVVVAEAPKAPAADTAAPADKTDKPADKADKKVKKADKKVKATKGEGKTEAKPEGTKEMAPSMPATK